MGVDYDAFLGIGKRFARKWQVENFLIENTGFSETEIDNMIDHGLDEQGVSVTCLNQYSGEDWFVGFEIGGEFPNKLISNVVDAHERWEEMFRGVEARVVHAVKVW